METTANGGTKLRPVLKNRQMMMIAIGGVIGAGLFVGSGTAISVAGPAVIVAYAAIGALVVLIMQMLAEMSVANPDSGSFATYATRHVGPWAGLSVGWLYAYQWFVTVGFEAAVGAGITHMLLPAIPTWLAALVLMMALIAVNFLKVEGFGTFEYWFAMIKVAAITVFLIIGVVAILGLFPGTPAPGLSNLTGQGGFAPLGWAAIVPASLVVFFSFFGTEAVTIAAGEAVDPPLAVRRGIKSVVWRILLFYIGSMVVVVTLLPWNSASVTQSPYVAVLDKLGIPNAGLIMNLVVLTAVLSCLNSGIYASSRMVHAMALRGEAPQVLTRVTKSGVPAWAVFLASAAGLLVVVANYFLPSAAIYVFLLESSGSVAVVVYLFIVVTHLRSHRRLEAEAGPSGLQVKMWAYPYLSILALITLLVVIGGMAFDSGTRRSLLLTLLVTASVVIIGLVRQYRSRRGSGHRTDLPVQASK